MKPTRRTYIPKHSLKVKTTKDVRLETWKQLAIVAVGFCGFWAVYGLLELLGL